MLRITQQSSAEAARQYYTSADYYLDGQETVGRWGGQGARLLGLEGTVTRGAFNRLCDNRDPRDPRQRSDGLEDPRRAHRVAAAHVERQLVVLAGCVVEMARDFLHAHAVLREHAAHVLDERVDVVRAGTHLQPAVDDLAAVLLGEDEEERPERSPAVAADDDDDTEELNADVDTSDDEEDEDEEEEEVVDTSDDDAE